MNNTTLALKLKSTIVPSLIRFDFFGGIASKLFNPHGFEYESIDYVIPLLTRSHSDID